MLISWFLPWWRCEVEELQLPSAVVIHPYGLYLDPSVAPYLKWAALPGWFGPAVWTYLGLAIAALLISVIFMKKNIKLFGKEINLSRWLVGLVGFSYIVTVILAVVIASAKMSVAGMSLLGRIFVSMGSMMASSWAEGFLLFGYWLACGVGIYLFILALLRNKILGKSLK
jgi:hypothetical protein